jgi:hypothetical protein
MTLEEAVEAIQQLEQDVADLQDLTRRQDDRIGALEWQIGSHEVQLQHLRA